MIQRVPEAVGFILVKLLIILAKVTELVFELIGMDVHNIKIIKYRRGILERWLAKWNRETYRDTDNYFINYVVFKIKYLISDYIHSLI